MPPGSEHAALDSEKEQGWNTAVDAPSTEVPSPAIDMTGPAESQHTKQAEQAVSTSEALPVAEIPQSAGDEAQSPPHVADEKADGADINAFWLKFKGKMKNILRNDAKWS